MGMLFVGVGVVWVGFWFMEMKYYVCNGVCGILIGVEEGVVDGVWVCLFDLDEWKFDY